MKVYIAGKITGTTDYKERFDKAANALEREGLVVLNPTILPAGLAYTDYMHICFSMVTVCDVLYLLPGWEDSPGVRMELALARRLNKLVCKIHEPKRVTL